MRKKILIVDDEKDLLAITKLNLERTNKYEVRTLPNAKDIISQVHNFSPDIILIDIVMPEIGGLEACEMLNKDSIGSKIPIIFLTAADKDTANLKAYRVGIADYIAKPVEADHLIAKIEKALINLPI